MNWQHAPRQLQSLVRVGYATMALSISRAGAGTLPPGPTAGHARRANRASTRFTSVEQASEEGVEEGVQAWALDQLAAL